MSTFSIRRDAELDQALAELMSDGLNQTAAVRAAVLAAAQQHRRERQRRQAEQVAADEADRAESRAVLAEMESLGDW
ncbi:hypothetical protein [Longispora fulva]|uniref:Spy/CpxP family protein refolding chaperone n=1 Tax=Longispora fulva TaxID=619741 RepID=A0A8J7GY95_9ACTN|nr:hypothetical protein [Longispora fulva]MBG6139843.1 Spy/CpxP family protein refolding chaperone [Longispora fulva]